MGCWEVGEWVMKKNKNGRRKQRATVTAEANKKGCSQDIADSSDKGQALTIVDMEVPLWGFTAMDSDADKRESASLMLTISMTPRSTS